MPTISNPPMSDETTSEFIGHKPCPKCGSSDALAEYDDHSYCFACEHWEGGASEGTSVSPSSITITGEVGPIKSRSIREGTVKKFGVRMEPGRLKFPYYSDGRLIAYKERGVEKTFKWVGKNPKPVLFGAHLFGSGKSIVITEGEMDALSVYQARPKWPVVSVPNGAQSAYKALKANLPYLLGFDEIVLFFDNDEPGQAAAQDCAALFPPDQVYIAVMGAYKDASDALVAGDSDAIMQALWNKQTYAPQSIVDGRSLFDEVVSPLHGRDASWPYDSLDSITGGLRKGELVTITAGSGSGKSTLCGEVAQSLITQNETVGYIALEESVKRTALRLMSVVANKPLHLDNNIPIEEMEKAFKASVGSGRFYARDGFGSIDVDLILNDIRYLNKAYGCQWIILDHLSILVSGTETNDERKTLDVAMTRLRSFVEETGIGMILISHLRRNQGDKGHEDGAAISLSQLRGSHSIAQLSDIVIAVERNISAGDDIAELRVLKNRFNGQTGPAGQLLYNKKTGRLQTNLDFTIETPTTTDGSTNYQDF